jgi:hypothetical protein
MSELVLMTPEVKALEEAKAVSVIEPFKAIAIEYEEFTERYNELIAESDVKITRETVQKARRLRLDMAKPRHRVEDTRKSEKSSFLVMGTAIDSLAKKMKLAMATKEAKLEKIEKYFEELERVKRDNIHKQRVIELTPFIQDINDYPNLATFTSEEFKALLSIKKKEKADKEEADRIAQEEADRIQKVKEQKDARLNEAITKGFSQFLGDSNLGEMSDEEWKKLKASCMKKKRKKDIGDARTKEALDGGYSQYLGGVNLSELSEAKWDELKNSCLQKKHKDDTKRERDTEIITKGISPFLPSNIVFGDLPDLEWEKVKADALERKKAFDDKQAEIAATNKRLLEEKKKADQDKIDKAKEEQDRLKMSDSDKVESLIQDLHELKTKYEFKSQKFIKKYEGVTTLIDKVIAYIND